MRYYEIAGLLDELRKTFHGWRLHYDPKTGQVKLESPQFKFAMTPEEIMRLAKEKKITLTTEQESKLQEIMAKQQLPGWAILGGIFLAVALLLTILRR